MKADRGKIIVAPIEALEELISLMKAHQMRKILSDRDALNETIARMSAVLEMYKEYKVKEKKNARTASD